MALDLQVTQVTINTDGSYNVYVQAVDTTTGKVLIKKTVTATSKEDLKNKVRPHWEAFKTHYEEHQILIAMANDAMDELEAET